MTGDIGTGELARQVQEVLSRFQGLAGRLDTSYVTKEVFDLYQRSTKQTTDALEKDKAEKTVQDDALRRIANLEDNLKWIVRLILGLIVLAIVGLVIATGGAK